MAAPMRKPRLWATRDVRMHMVSSIMKRITSGGCDVIKYTIST